MAALQIQRAALEEQVHQHLRGIANWTVSANVGEIDFTIEAAMASVKVHVGTGCRLAAIDVRARPLGYSKSDWAKCALLKTTDNVYVALLGACELESNATWSKRWLLIGKRLEIEHHDAGHFLTRFRVLRLRDGHDSSLASSYAVLELNSVSQVMDLVVARRGTAGEAAHIFGEPQHEEASDVSTWPSYSPLRPP